METINWDRRSYTEFEFIEVWFSQNTLSSILTELGYEINGGNFNTVKQTANILGLSDEHFSYEIRNSVKNFFSGKRQLSEILIENSPISSTYHLKNRLYSEGLKTKVCERCKTSEWMGSPVPLDLDHINGIKNDNRIENLKILCKNCHGQTPTYGGRNQKRAKTNAILRDKKRLERELKRKEIKENIRKSPPKKPCLGCPNLTDSRSKGYCSICSHKQLDKGLKAKYPSTKEMILRIQEIGYSAYGRELGVSDNAIRKYLKNRGIDKLPAKQKQVIICNFCENKATNGTKSCDEHKPKRNVYPPTSEIVAGVKEHGWTGYAKLLEIDDYRNIINYLKTRNISLSLREHQI